MHLRALAVVVLGGLLSACAALDMPSNPAREPRRTGATASAEQAPGLTQRRQYYDQRRQRYYFYDRGRKAYFWEDGSPKI